jgi:hypothetical protein
MNKLLLALLVAGKLFKQRNSAQDMLAARHCDASLTSHAHI